MPIEPGLIDANVLVYAMDADAPQHARSRALLESAHATSTAVYVTLQTLCEFYSVVTNPRRVSKPRSSADALSAISGLLAFVHILPVPTTTVDGLLDLLRRRPVTGGDYLRFASCSDHESQRHPQNLHVQRRRFRGLFRA